jgi:hypothetical protein
VESRHWARLGHCRNRFVASFLGLLLGLVAYASYYQCDLAYNFSRPMPLVFVGREQPGFWELLPKVRDLPRYVDLRLRSDRVGKVGEESDEELKLDDGKQPGNMPEFKLPPIPIINWFTFGIEGLIVALVPACVAWHYTKTPYAELQKRWMPKQTLTLAPSDAIGVVEAILEDNPKLLTEGEGKPGALPGRVILHFVPDAVEESPVFLTLTWVAPPSNNGVSVSVAALHAVKLKPEEIAVFANQFHVPGLRAISAAVETPE